MPPTTTGHSTPVLAQRVASPRGSARGGSRRGSRGRSRATPSCSGRGGDLGRGQADALVDDLHADVARAHGDLLGAVGVAVEARACRPGSSAGGRAARSAAATCSRELLELWPRDRRGWRAPRRHRSGRGRSRRPRAASPPTRRSLRPLARRRSCGTMRFSRSRSSAATRASSASAASTARLVALGAPPLDAPRSAALRPRGRRPGCRRRRPRSAARARSR